MSRYQTKEQRFWGKVDKAGPTPAHCPELGACWLWTGRKDKYGYGTLYTGPQGAVVGEASHRLSFFLAHGRWPRPCALHRCDNPACVNPAHLFEGDRGDNIRDCVAKGRHRAPDTRGPRNGMTKLTAEAIPVIRDRRISGKELAERYGVTQTTISDIRKGRTWRHVA